MCSVASAKGRQAAARWGPDMSIACRVLSRTTTVAATGASSSVRKCEHRTW